MAQHSPNSNFCFSPLEKVRLQEFKARVHSIYPECDEKCITWLRARELNVDKAEQMLRRHLIWAKNNELESLRSWTSPKVYLPYIYLGVDFDAEPVFLLPFGRCDLRASVEVGDLVPSLRFVFQCLDNIVLTANAAGKYQGSVIFDMDGFSYRQLGCRTLVQGILEVLRIFDSNYPEVLKASYVINAPKIFNLLFALIKPLLHSRTLAKVFIYNDDSSRWSEALFKVMPKNIVPPYWCGTRIGSDEYCSEAWYQEPLPRYFMKKLSSSFDEFGEEWILQKIPARDALSLEYVLADHKKGSVDSVLRWGFYTDGYDIGFNVLYCGVKVKEASDDEDDGGSLDELVAYTRVDSHESNKTLGSLKVHKPGKYILQFDNTYSRARAKFIHYSISLTSVPTKTNVAAKALSLGGSRRASLVSVVSNGSNGHGHVHGRVGVGVSVSEMNELNGKMNQSNNHHIVGDVNHKIGLEIKTPT